MLLTFVDQRRHPDVGNCHEDSGHCFGSWLIINLFAYFLVCTELLAVDHELKSLLSSNKITSSTGTDTKINVIL